MVTPNPSLTPQYTGQPPQPTSDQPILQLSLKTFGLGGAPNAPAPGLNTGVPNDAFQRSAPAGAPTPALAGSPQQQLQQAYMEAENSRNKYLALANQLNSAAYQNQLSPQTLPGGSVGQPAGFQPPVADPNQQSQQQLQQMQQQLQQEQQAALAQQQQAAEQARLQAEQQMQQQQMLQAQQQAATGQQQPPVDPTQQQQPPVQQPGAPQDLSFASVEELNAMLQGQTLQDKVNAMAEFSTRGVGNAATYDTLKKTALGDPTMVPPGPEGSYARQTALWTLGIMNAVQNAGAPTAQLPGMNVISQLVNDNNADPTLKVAAIQALQVINRPNDATVKQILKKAQKDTSPDVKARAQSAAAGEAIPLPTQQAVQGPAPQQQAMPPEAILPEQLQLPPAATIPQQAQQPPVAPQA